MSEPCTADHLSLQDPQGLLQLGLILMQFSNALLQFIKKVFLLYLTLSGKNLVTAQLVSANGQKQAA